MTEQFDYVPGKPVVLKHIYPKYACSCCNDGVTSAEPVLGYHNHWNWNRNARQGSTPYRTEPYNASSRPTLRTGYPTDCSCENDHYRCASGRPRSFLWAGRADGNAMHRPSDRTRCAHGRRPMVTVSLLPTGPASGCPGSSYVPGEAPLERRGRPREAARSPLGTVTL